MNTLFFAKQFPWLVCHAELWWAQVSSTEAPRNYEEVSQTNDEIELKFIGLIIHNIKTNDLST